MTECEIKPELVSEVTSGIKPHFRTLDYSKVSVADKFELSLENTVGEGFTPFESNHYKLRVHSPNLKNLYIETNFGLVAGLAPDENSFFTSSLDDDTSYKLLCPMCLGKVEKPRHGDKEFLSCRGCHHVFENWPTHNSETLWLCPGGIQLAMDKASKRTDRAAGNFPTLDPTVVEDFLKGHDFTNDIVQWVSPFFTDPLRSHVGGWDLAESLEDVWRCWKAVKKYRKVEKKLSGFRLIENLFNDPEWKTWSKYKSRLTGALVIEKVL